MSFLRDNGEKRSDCNAGADREVKFSRATIGCFRTCRGFLATHSPQRPDQSEHGLDQVERRRENVILYVFSTLQDDLRPRQLEFLRVDDK